MECLRDYYPPLSDGRCLEKCCFMCFVQFFSCFWLEDRSGSGDSILAGSRILNTCPYMCFQLSLTATKPPLASFSLFLQFQIFRPLILLLLTLKVSLLKEELMLCVSFSHPSAAPFATALLHISMVPK